MNRLIAYLGILACIILGGILGLIASVLALGTLGALGVDIEIYHILIGITLGAFIGGVLAVIHVHRYTRKQADMQFAKCLASVPENAGDLIKAIIGEMRYSKKVQDDVMSELIAHFEDELRDCKSDEEKEKRAEKLINEFGDVKLLAVLMRRAKKRCRPLWQTAIVRTSQTIGVVIGLLFLYTLWFISGKPTISVDYLVQINQMNRPQVMDEDNAWPNYEKAIGLFIEPNKTVEKMAVFKNYNEAKYRDFRNLTDVEQKEIREWVEHNEQAWHEIVSGSEKSYCYKEAEYYSKDKEKWLWNVLAQHLAPLHGLAKVGIWRARIEIEQGRIQQAMEDCLVIARVGSHWQKKRPFTIEQIAGSAISTRANEEMLYITATHKLSATNLNQLQQQLLQIYSQGYPLPDIETQRVPFLDLVQHIFTDGGLGGGHLIPDKLVYYLHLIKGKRKQESVISVIPYIYTSIVHAQRVETIAKYNEVFDQLTDIAKMSPYERHIRNVNEKDIISALPEDKYSLIHIQFSSPYLSQLSEISYRNRSQYEALLTVLAIQQWQLEKGQYPESLDKLVYTSYLKESPMDPYSNKSLLYKKTDDGFILYSVGPDFTDDGGTVAVVDGKPQRWGTKNEGDVVFWPVIK